MNQQSELALKIRTLKLRKALLMLIEHADFAENNDDEADARDLIIKDLEKEPDTRIYTGVEQLVLFGNLFADIGRVNSPFADLPADLACSVDDAVINVLVEYLLNETENIDQAVQFILDWRYPENTKVVA